jgi:CheY-like chemotaxis protein
MERVDLSQVIRESLEGLHPGAIDKGVTLVTQVDPNPVPTVGDSARLQQVVWNLVSNAIKFTPKGGTVTVALRTVGERAEITVADTGIGIPPESLSEIFERFRQGSSMTTRRHGGLGLGLSITRHLVEMHGGAVHARSAGVDQGATFTVELPLRASEPADLELHLVDEEAAAQAGSVSLRDIRVLVVEDDRDTRDLIRRLLEAHQAEVVIAATAPEAQELLAAVRPDILVSDIGLPDVDGYELIQRVRQAGDSIANIPAVALTAFARYEDRTRALRAGYNAHVAKPVEPTELLVTVASFTNLILANRQR